MAVWATGLAYAQVSDVNDLMKPSPDAPPRVVARTAASVVEVRERRGPRKRGNKLGRAAIIAASGAITSECVSLACATLGNPSPV